MDETQQGLESSIIIIITQHHATFNPIELMSSNETKLSEPTDKWINYIELN